MALNYSQKNRLDNAISNHFEEISALEKFTNQMIIDMIRNDIDFADELVATSIVSAFNRLYQYSRSVAYKDNGKIGSRNAYALYTIEFAPTTEVIKNRNILTFVNGIEGKENITYNFATGEWSKPMNIRVNNLDWHMREIFLNLNEMLKYEWLFNYSTDLETISYIIRNCSEEMYSTCPNGYIKFIQETDRPFDYNTLEEFYLKSKYGVVGYNLRESIGSRNADWLFKNGLVKNFTKCLVENSKSGLIENGHIIETCIDMWKKANNIKGETLSLDTSKSFSQNSTMFENIVNAEKNEGLARQLKKLNFINGLVSNGLCVVVPQSQDEKKNEGEQQRNCVGYYYDNSILDGENYIFFVRKLDNVKKSYVTCRYNVRSKSVAEYRGFSNSNVKDLNALNFIKEIEKIINDNLSNLK